MLFLFLPETKPVMLKMNADSPIQAFPYKPVGLD